MAARSTTQTITIRRHEHTDSICLIRNLRGGDRVRYADGVEAIVLWTHRLDHGSTGWLITHLDAPDRVVGAATIVRRLNRRGTYGPASAEVTPTV